MSKMHRKNRFLGRFDGKKRGWFHQFREFLIILLILVLLFQLVVGFFFVKGESMMPTLENGELAFYVRVTRTYEREDIVSVRLPSGEKYVKRLVGLPGDTIDFQDGKLVINGEAKEESYAVGSSEAMGNTLTYPLTLGENEYFVLGDNRENSMDSRVFGPVLKSELKGQVLFHVGTEK